MAKRPNVIHLACPHTPHTNQVRVRCQPPIVIFSSCAECAEKFLEACVGLGGEIVKPEIMM